MLVDWGGGGGWYAWIRRIVPRTRSARGRKGMVGRVDLRCEEFGKSVDQFEL